MARAKVKSYFKIYFQSGFDYKNLNFNFQDGKRNYTFATNMVNYIYAKWTVKKDARVRKIGKLVDGKFILEVDGGDRLTKKEIEKLNQFLSEKFENSSSAEDYTYSEQIDLENLNKKDEDLAYIRLKNTKNLNKQEWLKERQRGIGGSDLGGILGLSKWSNPYKVWLEKTGQGKDDFNANFFTKVGNELEDLVAREFCERENKEVKIEPNILQSKQYPFMIANIDRWVIGENAGLECKTINIFKLKEIKQGIVPQQYILQCMHYMAVTGATHWYLSFLVVGTADEFYTFKIDRDENLIEIIINKLKDFWYLVENNIEPEICVDGENITTQRLMDLIKVDNSEQVFLSDESNFKLLDSIKKQIKELEKQEEKIKQEILLKMDGNSKAISENFEIKVTETTRSTFDKKKLFELVEISEEIREKCTKTSTSRTLKIKKLMEEK